MPLRRIAHQKTLIEIVHQIRASPVELRSNRGHECGEESGNHKSSQGRRQKIAQHHHVALLRILREVRTGMETAVRRIHHDRDQGGQYPWPGSKRVVRDVKPKRRAKRVFLVLGTEHPLRNITAASGLSAWIPCQPPLHSQKNNECEHRQRPYCLAGHAVAKIWKKSRRIGGWSASGLHVVLDCLQMRLKFMHAADLCDSDPSQNNNHCHLERELKKIGHQHSPQSAYERVEPGKRNEHKDADRKRSVMRLAKRPVESTEL